MELAFQADYPSQWLFTELLLPQIRKAKGRIVQLVSKAYRLACVQSKRWNCMDLKRLPPPVIEGNQTAPARLLSGVARPAARACRASSLGKHKLIEHSKFTKEAQKAEEAT